MIEAIHLSKRYPNGTLALDALNLRIEPGEIYCLLGARGAGKTTVVDLFFGFTQPTAGRALIDGIDASREPLQAKTRAAYLAAGTEFYRRLTARQNLEFFARLGGRSDQIRADCEMALREVGLPEEAFNRKVGDFSTEMIRKLGIAAVMVKKAPAVLLDEPLAGIDPNTAAEVVELLSSLRSSGRALLITLEDPFWVKQLADRVSILQEGRQVLTRTREELRHESLEKLYLDYMRGHRHPLP